MRDWYNVSEKTLKMPNGSAIVFGFAEHEHDIYDFQGVEFMDVIPDEATHFKEKELTFLKTCNRWTGLPDGMCKMILTCNPGNVGHAFVKRVFIDGDYHENESASDYTFLQAFGWDNVGWAESALTADGLAAKDYYRWSDEKRFQYFIQRTDYGKRLNALPAAMRIGHLMGRWDQFAGQYFTIFNRSEHVIPAQTVRLNSWDRRWISIDWGFAHNAAIYWHAKTETNTITYRERVVSGMSPKVLAQEIVEKNSGDRIGEIILSGDAFARKTSDLTIAIQMEEVFRQDGLPSPVQAEMTHGARISGWQLMYSLLESKEWLISDACPALIECIPTLTRDEDDPEDVLKMDGDDPADAARYGIHNRVTPRQKPFEGRLAEAVAAIPPTADGHPNYNAIHMLNLRMQDEERKRWQPIPLTRMARFLERSRPR